MADTENPAFLWWGEGGRGGGGRVVDDRNANSPCLYAKNQC